MNKRSVIGAIIVPLCLLLTPRAHAMEGHPANDTLNAVLFVYIYTQLVKPSTDFTCHLEKIEECSQTVSFTLHLQRLDQQDENPLLKQLMFDETSQKLMEISDQAPPKAIIALSKQDKLV